MPEEQDNSDKPHDPSHKRLTDARNKGDMARSQDLTNALSYAGLFAGMLFLGPIAIERLGSLGVSLLGGRASVFQSADTGDFRDAIFSEILISLLPILAAPALLVILGSLAQGHFVMAWNKLEPKLSKISPISNAGQKYGRKGLFEFAKSLTKLSVVSLVLVLVAWREIGEIVTAMQLEPRLMIMRMLWLAKSFLAAVLVVTVIIAAADYLWQYFEFMRRNRMSHQEMKDEYKESEGDPHFKGERKQRGHELVGKSLMQAVQKADVLVVNPEHYAVALSWDRATQTAPVCAAKGVDQIALKMREIAKEAGIPIHPDPPTARALYATLKVGDEVDPEYYKPVAAAIRFAEALRKRRLEQGF